MVGAGVDYAASVSPYQTPIGQVEVTFPWQSNIASEHSYNYPDHNDRYSIQVNSNWFATPACNGAGNCYGWQQFVYSTENWDLPAIAIQYNLVNYLLTYASCPAGWTETTDNPDCYTFSDLVEVSKVTIANLSTVQLCAQANAWGYDQLWFADGQDVWVVSVPATVLSLYQGWNWAESNVFGDASGDRAIFVPVAGTTAWLEVEQTVSAGSGVTCTSNGSGWTFETNSLFLSSCYSSGQTLFFYEHS